MAVNSYCLLGYEAATCKKITNVSEELLLLASRQEIKSREEFRVHI
jgi:hypothetical protein